MLTRRLLAGSTATLAAPYVASHARAATPKNAVVMVRQIDDIVSFDPAESYEFTNNEVDGNCYRRLVRPDPADSTKVAGDLAESYDVSADGLTFTFKLKQDAKFDSGNPVTAHDAAFSLQRVVKLNKSRVASIIDAAMRYRGQPDFFRDPPCGINCESGFMRIGDDGTQVEATLEDLVARRADA